VLEIRPGVDPVGQDDDPVVRRGDPELVGRAEHSVGHDAADLARGQRLRQRRHPSPWWRKRNHVAGSHVAHADHDLELARSRLDAGQAQAVRVRVIAHLDDARGDDALEPLPRPVDALDLGAPGRQ
jgi:hypothetical protein